MRCLKGFYMSLGMFSAIPLPYHFWNEKYLPVMVAGFPLVGGVIGGLWWLAAWGLIALGIPLMLTAAALTLSPFLIAGFIHLDGFMDTSDAHLSRRPLKERLRILKDPLVGTFAVVMLAVLLLFQFAAMYIVAENGGYLALLVTISVLARCCSTLAIFGLKHLSISNYGPLLAQGVSVSHKVFVFVAAAGAIALSFVYAGIPGLIVAAAVVLGYCAAMSRVYRSFGGVSGDLLGYSQVISEVCGLIALALIQGW
ncbi:MAG: adenosylcobinamide-GDP ribazoletransferase [Oscillospiraceae bacterium]|nr:adenosylcobinamide-GDP ribazoletransferase [Oscillospiraceae bacterium]